MGRMINFFLGLNMLGETKGCVLLSVYNLSILNIFRQSNIQSKNTTFRLILHAIALSYKIEICYLFVKYVTLLCGDACNFLL